MAIPSGERAMSKTSALRLRCLEKIETPRIVVVVEAVTGPDSASGPGQVTERPVADQDGSRRIERTADPVLLANDAVVVDPGGPVVGRQRAQLRTVHRRVEVQLGHPRTQCGEVPLEDLAGSHAGHEAEVVGE